MKFERRDYSDANALDQLAHKIAEAVPELIDAKRARFKVFFVSKEMEHIGGKTRKLDGAVRYQTQLDYFVLIHKEPFADSDDLHKLRLVCHELYHIMKEGESWVIRRHDGDFCEIAKHDAFSYRLALKAMSLLGLKYQNEPEAKRFAHIP